MGMCQLNAIQLTLTNEGGDEMILKEAREQCHMTQAEAAAFLHIPLRTYQRYEIDKKYTTSLKYQKMMEMLKDHSRLDETHGILSLQSIREKIAPVLKKYEVSYSYLFGSYAKGKATEVSDVDLLVASNATGLTYYGLLQDLMDVLHKKVDLIKFDDATKNTELMNEILQTGVKVYG